MPRPFAPRNGEALQPQPSGFPSFYGKNRKSRIITGDIWACLRHISKEGLSKREADKAVAYLDQAQDFFAAAHNPKQSSRPLLYYYAFLNLSKVLLLNRGLQLPIKLQHGLSDPRTNSKQRLKFPGQQIHIPNLAYDHSSLFPELLTTLNPKARLPANHKTLNLLGQIPGIHRTFSTLMGQTLFCPAKLIELRRNSNCDKIWVHLRVQERDRDVRETLSQIRNRQEFKRHLRPVQSAEQGIIAFESWNEQPYSGRSIDSAIAKLADQMRECRISTLLSRNGYKCYFSATPKTQWLPDLAATYGVMFYLGSVTRYKPEDFDKITNGYEWLISEFLDVEPWQFLYKLASVCASAEVVSPNAIGVR